MKPIDLDFTAQPPIPAAGIERANELMADGALFRYGEHGANNLDAAELERRFAALVGTKYCVALNSCGAALATALYAAGVQSGDQVVMNAFTLAPVPGAVARLGAKPVLVEITDDLTVDLDHLDHQLAQSGARFVMLSHMRGHIADLDAVSAICDRHGATLIEDCAHTMGATWKAKPTGTFGRVGCFSTQTFKHINSGEGGLLVTDDDDIAARAILYSGSYMLYDQHGTVPEPAVMERHRSQVPNCSMRLSALAAALAASQLDAIEPRARQWNALYRRLEGGLVNHGFILPERPEAEGFVGSSIQFALPPTAGSGGAEFVADAAAAGVAVKWFGGAEPVGFTSRFDQWRYVREQALPTTAKVLANLFDMRIPLAMTNTQADDIVAALARSARLEASA